MHGMSERVQNARGIFVGRVARRRKPCREHFELTICIDDFPAAEPGQFVQLLCASPTYRTPDTVDRASAAPDVRSADAGILLRRPFSIGGLRRKGRRCEIDVMGRVVGPGTAWLDARMPGDEIDLLGPLGTPFRMPNSSARALLIAGGVGLPPIRWLGEALSRHGVRTHAIFGAQTESLVPLTLTKPPANTAEFTPCAAEFAEFGVDTIITTDDGSCGVLGRVTVAMRSVIEENPGASMHVFACGPEPMLEAVAALAGTFGLPCQLALERVMACGMGTCQSCVVRVVDDEAEDGWRYALCCSEGPVFEASRVAWSD